MPVATQELALARVETVTPAQLFQPAIIDPILDAIRVEVRMQAADLDISTIENRKAIASLAYKVGRSKTFIDGQRKSLVEDEKKRLKAIDREGARIWDELEALQAEVRKPLTDWENAEKARVAAHESALAELIEAGAHTLRNWQELPLEAMRDRLSEIKGNKRDWQEFLDRARVAAVKAIGEIKEAIARRETLEAERAELERLRAEAAERAWREREEAIAKAAREKAEAEAREREQAALAAAERERQRIEAEKFEAEAKAKQAEEARLAAIAQAEQEKAAAEEAARVAEEARLKAIADAEQERIDALARAEEYRKQVEADRIAAEAKAAADRVAAEAAHAAELERLEKQRLADELAALERTRAQIAKAKADQDAAVEAERQRAAAEARRAAEEAEARAKDTAHKAAINREILASLLLVEGMDDATAKNVIAFIARGQIKHIKIEY